MNWKRWSHRIGGILLTGTWLCVTSGGQIGPLEVRPLNLAKEQASADSASAAQTDGELSIKTDTNLPDTHPGLPYLVHLEAAGGVPRMHWRLESGALPPGIKLTEDGLLTGSAERGGEFQFKVSVRDSSGSSQAKRKDFVIHVRTALSLNWKSEAQVNGNRIEGSVKVSNGTPYVIDLTFVVLAVAGNGRATAIGYQHFPLPKGAFEMELPFGETLPPGGYVVHVDVVGEVAAKNIIYRERLQTPKPLQVTVGP
jgi:hypothetical protein